MLRSGKTVGGRTNSDPQPTLRLVAQASRTNRLKKPSPREPRPAQLLANFGSDDDKAAPWPGIAVLYEAGRKTHAIE